MFYQGEDIAINVTFDEETLSNASEFWLLVYPTQHTKREPFVQTVAVSGIVDMQYTFHIPYAYTSQMGVGQYTIEILMKGITDTRSIYQQKNAFQLEYAKAKEVVDNGTGDVEQA